MEGIPDDYVLSDTSQMSIEQIAKVTNATFAGYFVPVQHTTQSFAAACRAWNIDVAQSIVLEKKDGRMVGLAMLGARGDRGWCGGFGILPRYRGRGLGHVLARGMIERARTIGLRTLQLECFVDNEPAMRVYRSAGFRVWRTVSTVTADLDVISYKIKPGTSMFLDIQEATPAEGIYTAMRLGAAFMSAPTWQREPATIYAMSDLSCVVAGAKSNPRGVIIYRSTPDSHQVSIVLLAYTNKYVANALLKRAVNDAGPMHHAVGEDVTQVSLVNEPEESPFHEIGDGLGFRHTYRQQEMIIEL